jgi:hypothetical protein
MWTGRLGAMLGFLESRSPKGEHGALLHLGADVGPAPTGTSSRGVGGLRVDRSGIGIPRLNRMNLITQAFQELGGAFSIRVA